MFCKAPFLGITIDPNGLITMCCNTSDRNQFGGLTIEEVDDLEDFFQSQTYEDLRDVMMDEGIEGIKECSKCLSSIENGNTVTELHNYSKKKIGTPVAIKYLELTTSNTCNQSCVMCSSYFSSKWRKLEHLFDRHSYKSFHLSEKSVEKIIKILPQLDILQLKGGEPFADRNNLKFLEVLAEQNPSCEVIITSNFQNIPDDFLSIMNKLPYLTVSASIDGVDQTFDWIRGGNFKDAAHTMQNFFDRTGVRVSLLVTVSVYNIMKLREIKDYFANKEYVKSILFTNILTYPECMSVHHMNPDKYYSILESQDIRDEKQKTWAQIISDDLYVIKPKHNDMTDALLRHSNTMSKIRGFDIFDIQPELTDIFK